jgi:tetratricopeptide (TPR) repeat protein
MYSPRDVLFELIQQASLTDTEFTDIVYTHFPFVHAEFTESQSKSQRVRFLLEYIDKHRELDNLLKLIKSRNSTVYVEYESRIAQIEFIPTPKTPVLQPEPPHNLPLSGAKEFVGRQQELEQLHQQLQATARVAISTVTGMGGIGKTELALRYGWKYRQQSYPGGVCWLLERGQDLASQIISYSQIQFNLNIPPELGLDVPQQVAYCWRNWVGSGDVLVIFDDVTSYQNIKPYLPPASSRFKVIVTSRLQHLAQAFQRLELEILSEDAALELLISLVGADRINAELDTAKHLCKWLGYLPLGLELVGQYLAEREDLSLAEMQERLNKKRLEQTALIEPTFETTAKKGVTAAFELSWQELNESAQRVAGLLSLMALAPIPWQLVRSCFSEVDEEELEDIRDRELVKRSLLTRTDTATYQLHQLLKEFISNRLKDAEWMDNLKHQFCQVIVEVAQRINQTPTVTEISQIAPDIPHIAEAAEYLIDWVKVEDVVWLFTSLGRFYEGQGLYSLAEPWLNLCVSIMQKLLGAEHPFVAASLDNLAGLYCSQGQYEQAEPLYIQSLKMRQELLGAEHPDVAASLNNLAGLYCSQGQYEEAEPLCIQSLGMMQKLLGAEHLSVATSLNNLALLYRSKGRYEEAEPLYIQSLEMMQKLLGAEHLSVATSLNNLALLYSIQCRYEEAETLYIESLKMRQKLLAEEHPSVANSLNNLAGLYRSQDRYTDAELLYIQALSILISNLGENHPNTCGAWSSFVTLIQQAITQGQESLLSDHPLTQSLLQEMKKQRAEGGREE